MVLDCPVFVQDRLEGHGITGVPVRHVLPLENRPVIGAVVVIIDSTPGTGIEIIPERRDHAVRRGRIGQAFDNPKQAITRVRRNAVRAQEAVIVDIDRG